MSFKPTLLAGAIALAAALPAMAQDIAVTDAYARASSGMAQSGAAFMEITNNTDIDDRLIDVWSDAAARVELHTHVEDANGVMRMMQVEEGFPIASGETHVLARGGDHVMFMGLAHPFDQGDEIPITLVFEQAGEVPVTVVVDNERTPMMGAGQMNHGAMGNGNMGGAASN